MPSTDKGPSDLLLLGRGQFGDVKIDRRQSGNAVVKVIIGENENDTTIEKEDKDSFLYLVNQQCLLDHDNVIKVFEPITSLRGLSIVMEYAIFGSLIQVVKKVSDISLCLRVQFACDVLEGLSYLHSKELYHENLTASNILVTSNLRIKLTDYSQKRLYIIRQKYTNTEAPFGDLRYRTPEKCKDVTSRATEASDMYQFGCILGVLITNTEPCEGLPADDDVQISKAINNGKIFNLDKDANEFLCKHLLSMSYRDTMRPKLSDELKVFKWFKKVTAAECKDHEDENYKLCAKLQMNPQVTSDHDARHSQTHRKTAVSSPDSRDFRDRFSSGLDLGPSAKGDSETKAMVSNLSSLPQVPLAAEKGSGTVIKPMSTSQKYWPHHPVPPAGAHVHHHPQTASQIIHNQGPLVLGSNNTIRITHVTNTHAHRSASQEDVRASHPNQPDLRFRTASQGELEGWPSTQDDMRHLYHTQDGMGGYHPTQGAQQGYPQYQGPQKWYPQYQRTQSGYHQPQGAQSGYYQPQGTQSGYYQPQGGQSGYYQPQGGQSGTQGNYENLRSNKGQDYPDNSQTDYNTNQSNSGGLLSPLKPETFNFPEGKDVKTHHLTYLAENLDPTNYQLLFRHLGVSDVVIKRCRIDNFADGMKEVIYQTLREWYDTSETVTLNELIRGMRLNNRNDTADRFIEYIIKH